MGGSLFRKLFVVYAGVLAAIVLVVALVLSALTAGRMVEDRRKSLESAAAMASQAMRSYLAGSMDRERLADTIDMIGYIADARIYALRYDRGSLQAAADQLGDGSEADRTLVADLNALLDGRTVFHTRSYSAKLDTDVLLAGFPLEAEDGRIGGILMYAPMDRMRQDIRNMVMLLGAIAVGAMALGAVAIGWLSRGIVRPIRTMLERTENVRRGFIANVSHELRTPLTSIQGFLQGMLDGLVRPEDMRAHLLLMMDEVRRLGKLTGEVLDLAKLQSGTTTLVKEPVDIRALATDTMAALSGLPGSKRLDMSVAAGAPLMVYADADRIRQVLVNLLGNAVKFTPEGGSVHVGMDRDGDTVTLYVRDSGIGIPEEELPLVFEKFHRVDRTGNPAFGGSGLGLNIAKTIIELHRGTITALRRPEGGTEFVVRLPAT